ncbi:enoyl-CoA hydratase/isomerase family protein [Mycobacteroides abscessus]|uniref:enoyl-CoA hydratase/isomerase family protein n=1 Tax=Mycobacteroides abscessus TaxID=36809 RepID=UPI000926B8D4|nr:enoyl-CoA hydratase/isomerase family protein [Mycobacteroides abscessus]SHQ39947.1 enoyl-CoA hydratase/carnithine racemase [Mycobacteroides abscessus subsp. abscessus]
MLDVTHDDGIAVVRMAYGKVNILDRDALAELVNAFTTLTGNGRTRAVVLTGSAGAFSAGVDLKRLQSEGPSYVQQFVPVLAEAILTVFSCPLPVVAAVNGHAIAAGCLLAAAADVRLMSGGSIGLTELTVGVPLPVVATEVMRNTVGSFANTMINTAALLSPERAESIGLVTSVAAQELLARALQEARRLADVPPATFRDAKRQLHAPAIERIDAVTEEAAQATVDAWIAQVDNGRIAAFLASLART